jgi:DNA-directed RNA polymerase specialized sigma24 family protein
VTQPEIERALEQFGGLISTTAEQMAAAGVELEVDDLQQLLLIKAWQAVEKWDGQHVKPLPLRRWVFGCLLNYRKDIERRPRRHNASIDELRERTKLVVGAVADVDNADWFDLRYLSVDAGRVFFEVEDEPVLLPSTLTRRERRVIRLRLKGRGLLEIDAEMRISRTQREKLMTSIRVKLADWAPGSPAGRSGPTPPLPVAEPQRVALVA